MRGISVRGVVVWAGAAFIAAAGTQAFALDDDAAKALLKKSDCTKCHAIDKEKKGPPYQKIAAENKGKTDAEARLVKAVTSGQKVKLPDGSEEEHRKLDAKDPAQVKGLVQWILAQ
jgi:cytochrome c